MGYEPYGKHQLYQGHYEMSPGAVLRLPEKCQWEVRKYQGNRVFAASSNDQGEIALLLGEDYGEGYGFWSVISFLTVEEARLLAEQLLSAVKE